MRLNVRALLRPDRPYSIRLSKKESQVKSKKMDFSQEKSRKVNKKSKNIDFLLTFLDFS